jgi:hypothetical protein
VGTPTDAGVFSGADRTFTPGQRYLFLPLNDSTPFRDDACTGTRIYSHALDRFAPVGGVPTGTPHPGNPSSSSPLNLVSVTLVVALLAAAAWQVSRARRHAARPWGDPLLDPRKRHEPVDKEPPG